MNIPSRYPRNPWRKTAAGISGLFGMLAAATLLLPNQSFGTAAWSNKYKVNCRTCHMPTFARLNLDGERYLWNGYQSPDDEVPDGNKAGKRSFGENLSLEKEVGNWLMARLSVNPTPVVTYMPRENIRLSLYPIYDLRDVADNLKKHELTTNIRVGF